MRIESRLALHFVWDATLQPSILTPSIFSCKKNYTMKQELNKWYNNHMFWCFMQFYEIQRIVVPIHKDCFRVSLWYAFLDIWYLTSYFCNIFISLSTTVFQLKIISFQSWDNFFCNTFDIFFKWILIKLLEYRSYRFVVDIDKRENFKQLFVAGNVSRWVEHNHIVSPPFWSRMIDWLRCEVAQWTHS